MNSGSNSIDFKKEDSCSKSGNSNLVLTGKKVRYEIERANLYHHVKPEKQTLNSSMALHEKHGELKIRDEMEADITSVDHVRSKLALSK